MNLVSLEDENRMKFSLSTVALFKHVHSGEAFEPSPSQLAALQDVLVQILQDIDMFCSANHIQYFLGGGSALGAVRCQGMIPWDDDIDINMPRLDYERFIQVFPKQMGSKYWLHTPQSTKGYALQLTRIRLKGTSVKTREDFLNPDECGAFIDIFIIENIPDNLLMRWIHGTISMGLGFLLSCRKFFRERSYLKPIVAENPDLRIPYYFKTVLGFFTALFPIETWVRANDRWNGLYKSKKTQYTTVPAGRNHYWKEILKQSDLFPEKRMAFHGSSKPVYQHVQQYLLQLYGDDYMTPPSRENMESHVFFRPFNL